LPISKKRNISGTEPSTEATFGGLEYMNQVLLNKPSKNYDPACGDLMTMAERELAAFFSAVTESYGSRLALACAEDWLRELMASDDLPTSTRQWRELTIQASARIASRVNAPSASVARTLAYPG
jgi:hypothetical protein